MAIIRNNPWISGASGMVMGQIVYRQRAGRTIVSARQRKSEKPPSEKQIQHRNRFRLASRYAKMAAKSPETGPLYATKADGFNSAYNIALKDYMVAPTIGEFTIEKLRGRKGDPLGVYAHDDFGISKLSVMVLDTAGSMVSTGQGKEVIEIPTMSIACRQTCRRGR